MHLFEKLNDTVIGVRGRIGVYIRDLRTGEEWGIGEDSLFPMASVCKLPILVTAIRMHDKGLLDLNERVTIQDQHRTMGSGLLSAFDLGVAPTIRDLMLLMITVSDNAATDVVLQRATPKCVTRTMHNLGFMSIRFTRSLQEQIDAIYRGVDERFSGMRFGEFDDYLVRFPELREKVENQPIVRNAIRHAFVEDDVGSPKDLARLCELIVTEQCASSDGCKAMVDILGRQCLNTRLPRYIPYPDRVLHKTGTFGNGVVVNDVGVICRGTSPVISVAVLASEVENPMFETDEVIARIARIAYDELL